MTITEDEATTSSKKTTRVSNFDMSACTPMNFKGDLAVGWKDFHTQFNIFMLAAGLDDESDGRKNALLLSCMGKQSLVIFKSFDVEVSTIQHKDLIKKFQSHFSPKVNVTVERLTLFNRRQKINESLEDFLTALKNLSKHCQLDTLRESIVKDLFIGGMNSSNEKIKIELLQSSEQDLTKIFNLAQTLQLSKENSEKLSQREINTFASSSTSNSHRSSHRRSFSRSPSPRNHRQPRSYRHGSPHPRSYQRSSPYRRSSPHRRSSPYNNRMSPSNRSSPHRRSSSPHRRSSPFRQSRQPPARTSSVCADCGNQYHRFKCPAQNVECHLCKKVGHFSKMCRNKSINSVRLNKSDNNNNDESDSKNQVLFFGQISANNIAPLANESNAPSATANVFEISAPQAKKKRRRWFETILINDIPIQARIDTGAEINLISEETFNNFNLHNKFKIKPSHTNVTTVTQQPINIVGESRIDIVYNDRIYTDVFRLEFVNN